MANKYGHFDEEKREYVITRPDTPEPWINYLYGQTLLNAFISNGAGGMLWHDQPHTGRLTRYRHHGLPMDAPGFFLYVRDGEELWNPSFYPTMTGLDSYECRHGMWYTVFHAVKNNLTVGVRYFIPRQEEVLLWDVTVKNTGTERKTVRFYPYADFAAHDALKDMVYFNIGSLQMATKLVPDLGIVTYHHVYEAIYNGLLLFSSSLPFTAYDMDRGKFIGRGRSEANPVNLAGKLTNTDVACGGTYACGVLELPLTLEPGEEKRFNVKLIAAETEAELRKIAEKYNSSAAVDEAFVQAGKYWEDKLSRCRIETPSANADAMLNTWLPKNFATTMRCGRAISHRHPGWESSVHFRDTMQDIMPGCLFFPEEVRQKMLLLYRSVLQSGRITFSIHPVTFKCPNEQHNRCDAGVWGVMTLYKYLAETGDSGLLDEVIPYYDGGSGTVLEHQLRALHFIGEHTGDHGLPLLFDCDWNDELVVFSCAKAGGESIMVAEQFIYAARLFREILQQAGRMDEWPFFERKIQDFTAALASDAVWDGQWYRRLLYPDMVIGSRQNRECKIFLNAQSWAVLAGTLPQDQTVRAMDSVKEILDTECGLMMCYPGWTTLEDGKTQFPAHNPGTGENASLFFHANTWAVIAETRLHRSETAWKYFSQLLPGNLSDANADRYAREPYAFASWVYGPEHQDFGQANLTWLTGGAAWIYLAGTEHILGIRPTLSGLEVAPCIPCAWDGYRFTRRFRDVEVHITVRNPRHRDGSRVRLVLDGQALSGNLIPCTALAGRKHAEVEAEILG